MIDGTQPPRLLGKAAKDPSLPTTPDGIPQGMVVNNPLPKAPPAGGVRGEVVPIDPGANPLRQQMTALESEIRSIESGGGNASAKRAQLASIYDQLDPKRRNQASPQQSPPQQRPPVLLGGVPQPSIDINAIPTRAEELRSPDGSIDTSKIPVVPASKFNTSTTLMGALDQMFKGSPTDSLDDLSFKIEGKAKARSDIAPMLNSPNEAVSTILGLMKQYGAMELPSQTLSPEEQSYIEQSFQVGPGRKFATIDDIPDQYVNFALGYGLVGLMSGGGLRGFTDAIGAGTANVQQQFDQQYAADQAQFESSRAINAAMAKRQAEISNENFKQRGYYAKDMRDLVEKVTSNVQTLDRQMQIGVLTSLTDFFKTGDSDRWNQYVETMGPTLQKMRITLPKMMPKTSKEAQIDATIASMGLKDQRLNQVMQFAKDLHPYEMEKLMTEVSILDGKDQQAGVRLEMMQKELAWMDKTKRAQVMLMAARAEAIKTQAKARLIEAQKPNSGASAGNIAALKAAAQIDSSQITQLVKGKKINLDQIKLLEKAIEENTLKAKSKAFSSDESQKQINESTGQKVNQISDLKAKNNDIDKTIDSLAKSQEELAKKLRGEK